MTNNASDFRRLYKRESLHAGLVIIVPQVPPARQRELFGDLLASFESGANLINAVIEISIEGGEVIVSTYDLP